MIVVFFFRIHWDNKNPIMELLSRFVYLLNKLFDLNCINLRVIPEIILGHVLHIETVFPGAQDPRELLTRRLNILIPFLIFLQLLFFRLFSNES